MKKTYITPEVEINETLVATMMALSFEADPADDSQVLVKEENEWNMWEEE